MSSPKNPVDGITTEQMPDLSTVLHFQDGRLGGELLDDVPLHATEAKPNAADREEPCSSLSSRSPAMLR